MTKDQRNLRRGPRSSGLCWALGVGALFAVAGCINGSGNTANIALRKEVQDLQRQIRELNTQRANEQAQIASLTANREIPTLPADRMARLFATSSIRFKALVGGEDFDRNAPGDEGFKVSFTPVDQYGDEFKAAGSIKVELFDLSAPQPRVGEWTLTTSEAQPLWMSTPVFDGYLLKFRWPDGTVPANAKLNAKVTFTDELTGGSFDATTELTVRLPANATTTTTQPR